MTLGDAIQGIGKVLEATVIFLGTVLAAIFVVLMAANAAILLLAGLGWLLNILG